MRKRSKCAFLATAMAATTILAAGCGNSASGGQNTADSAERVPIRWLTTGDAAAEAIQDNDRIIEAINEKLGIDLTVEIVPEANTEKVNVAMASGDFPDVVTGAYGTSATQQWIDDGMVIPLNDYMDSFPSMKAWLENYEWSAQNGKYYGMPFITQYSVANTLIVMRQDWLDNLGLEAPTTIDEFEEVIRAFTEDDPDGNGEKDTYGFTYEGDTIYNNGWCADPVTIFSVYTGKNLPGQWQEDEDGKLVYGSLDEGNKKALERLARWHANGWTFQEAAATGAWDAMTQFTEGKAGIFIGRPWCIDSVKDVTSVAPDAVVKAYPNILQENGEMTYQDAELNDGWLMFNKNFNNMEAFFEYYDWAYNPAFGTDGFKYGYLDGYDYQIQGDKVVFDSNLFDPPVADAFMPGKSTVFKNSPGFSAMEAYAAVRDGKEPETGAEIRAAAHFESSYNCAEGYAIANDYKEYQNPSLFKAAPTASMSKYWEQLQTMEKQVYTNIIYGNESIDAFDKFVEDWYAQGGDKITEEVNEWYQSVK